MLNQNSITVVITTFNSSKFIDKTIESVLNQSIKVSAIIIVDDCSDDFMDLEKKFSKIKKDNQSIYFDIIHNEKNRGPGFSRNLGWNMVKTKFVAFLDSDDIWKINKLEKQLKIFEKNKDLSLVATAKNKQIKFFKTGLVNINKMLFRNLVPLSSVLIKSNIPYRFSERYYSEDYNLWLDLLFADLKIILINEILCFENKIPSRKKLSSNYIFMTLETQKTLSKFFFKKKIYFFNIFIAKIFEFIKFFLRVFIYYIKKGLRFD